VEDEIGVREWLAEILLATDFKRRNSMGRLSWVGWLHSGFLPCPPKLDVPDYSISDAPPTSTLRRFTLAFAR
jgi:hypothetical protein